MSDANATRIPPDSTTVRLWTAPPVGRDAPSARPGGKDRLLTVEQLASIEEQARLEGFRAGFEEGRQAGRTAGQDEIRREAARLGALFDAIAPQTSILDEELLAQLSELVIVIARQFVRRELRSQPGEVARVVREALKVLPASEARVRVFLNPDDSVLVRGTFAPDAVERPMRILEDPTVTRGGARLETDTSVIDATVEKRLGIIAARVLGDERQARLTDTPITESEYRESPDAISGTSSDAHPGTISDASDNAHAASPKLGEAHQGDSRFDDDADDADSDALQHE